MIQKQNLQDYEVTWAYICFVLVSFSIGVQHYRAYTLLVDQEKQGTSGCGALVIQVDLPSQLLTVSRLWYAYIGTANLLK